MIVDVNDGPVCDERLVNEVPAMRDRWGDEPYVDPSYDPNPSLGGGRFNLEKRAGALCRRTTEPDR